MARLRPPLAEPDESTPARPCRRRAWFNLGFGPAGASRRVAAEFGQHGPATATPAATPRTHTVKAGETPG